MDLPRISVRVLDPGEVDILFEEYVPVALQRVVLNKVNANCVGWTMTSYSQLTYDIQTVIDKVLTNLIHKGELFRDPISNNWTVAKRG